MDTQLSTQVEFKQYLLRINLSVSILSNLIISIDTFVRLLIEAIRKFRRLPKDFSSFSALDL